MLCSLGSKTIKKIKNEKGGLKTGLGAKYGADNYLWESALTKKKKKQTSNPPSSLEMWLFSFFFTNGG